MESDTLYICLKINFIEKLRTEIIQILCFSVLCCGKVLKMNLKSDIINMFFENLFMEVKYEEKI